MAGISVENFCLRICPMCVCMLKPELVAFSDGQSSGAGPVLSRDTGTLVRIWALESHVHGFQIFAKP